MMSPYPAFARCNAADFPNPRLPPVINAMGCDMFILLISKYQGFLFYTRTMFIDYPGDQEKLQVIHGKLKKRSPSVLEFQGTQPSGKNFSKPGSRHLWRNRWILIS